MQQVCGKRQGTAIVGIHYQEFFLDTKSTHLTSGADEGHSEQPHQSCPERFPGTPRAGTRSPRCGYPVNSGLLKGRGHPGLPVPSSKEWPGNRPFVHGSFAPPLTWPGGSWVGSWAKVIDQLRPLKPPVITEQTCIDDGVSDCPVGPMGESRHRGRLRLLVFASACSGCWDSGCLSHWAAAGRPG
jgi:hypothetical protein